MTDIKLRTVPLVAIALALLMFCQIRASHAHDIAGPIDPNGVPSFTVVAAVTCFDDGNGPADYMMARIKDLPSNPAVPGMFVNMTMLKANAALSITDIIPADDAPSQWIALRGGNGVYSLIVSKTLPGMREISVEYHCMTAFNVHTGTDIVLTYYGGL